MTLPTETSGSTALLGLALLTAVVIGGLAFVGSSPPTGSPSTGVATSPQDGPTTIIVFAHRLPAAYWAPCFASTCTAGTGPGATMYFILYDSQGNVVSTAFANEVGLVFSGLAPGATYYVFPEDCNLCHGSSHDVVFQHWGDGGTTRPLPAVPGSSLDAWYSCTNGCA